jgi:ribosomal protein S18 acetylase RimI-like enzyme
MPFADTRFDAVFSNGSFHEWADVPQTLAEIRRKLTVQPELFLVGCINGQIVATVMAGFDGVRGWVHHLAVHNPFRRKGVATALMQAAEKGLEALGCPKVNL